MNNGTILPFLGIGDYKNITENEMPKKKILLDVNTKYKNSKNVNFANYINPNIGDIELYNNPKTMNALGLSIVETDLSPGNVSWKACEIPLNLVGSTTDRPTENLFKGLQYFDTTLNKPIYWTGTK